jgi:hypothetical protein
MQNETMPKVVGKIDLDNMGTKNIPDTGFSSTQETVEENRVTVKQKTNAVFTFSLFSLLQFREGLDIFLYDLKSTPGNAGAILEIYTVLMRKFKDLSSAVEEHRESGLTCSITLDRSKVRLLKNFLEHRMSHCEKQREERALDRKSGRELFNPDTYIGQKILLIELREWLLGEVIE